MNNLKNTFDQGKKSFEAKKSEHPTGTKHDLPQTCRRRK